MQAAALADHRQNFQGAAPLRLCLKVALQCDGPQAVERCLILFDVPGFEQQQPL